MSMPAPTHSSRLFFILGTLVVALIIQACLTQGVLAAQLNISENPKALCSEGTEDPPLELLWDKLPKSDSLTTLAGNTLPMTLKNRSQHTLFVSIAVVGALDAARQQLDLGTVALAPFTDVPIAFDMSQFSFNIAYLNYSARIVARATARFTPNGDTQYIAYTPHAFLHMQGRNVLAYRARPMIERFGSGDFANRALPERQWADKRGIKLMGIGPAARGLKLTEDDGGPQKGR